MNNENKAKETLAEAVLVAKELLATAELKAKAFYTSAQDHDLIVAMHEQLKQVRVEIAELKDSTANQVKDHEIRIKSLETSVTRLMAYGTALIFIVGLAEFFISRIWK